MPQLPHILIAEDDAIDREDLSLMLSEHKRDFNFDFAENGVETMNFLNKAPVLPCLILLDLNMPKKDGFEVISEIKGSERLKNIPIIVLSGSSFSPDILKSYNLGANSYINKSDLSKSLSESVELIKKFWLHIVSNPMIKSAGY